MGSSGKGTLTIEEGLSEFRIPVEEEQEEETSAESQDGHYEVALEGRRLQANKLVDLSCLLSLVEVLVLQVMVRLVESWA
jgi:hypothetical protein